MCLAFEACVADAHVPLDDQVGGRASATRDDFSKAEITVERPGVSVGTPGDGDGESVGG